MSDVNEKLAKLKATAEEQIKGAGVSKIDDAALDEIVGRFRTIVNNRDAVLVSGTDPSELETVRKNFVVKRLGLDDKEKGEKAIQEVAAKLKQYKFKSRAAFYYLLKDAL